MHDLGSIVILQPMPHAALQGKLANVPVPRRIASTPGHYSIVGLLPEDHTFAKGSLFILAPGTKCIVFDLDGVLAWQLPCGVLNIRGFRLLI